MTALPAHDDLPPTYGLEPRYWREKRVHMLAEARQAEAAPAPSPVTPEEVEVLHSVDELTQVLRRRLEATASPHHPSLTEFVRCPHCVQSLLTALDAAKAALEFHRDHHTPALSVARHRGT